MIKNKLVYLISALILVFGLLGVIQGQPKTVQAAGKTVIYNLYATDGWQTLADGTTLYTYGFVGGREGESLTFAKSSQDGKPAGNVTLPKGAPSPTGGKMTKEEEVFLGNAQFPAPVIYASVGDIVEIRLKNLGVSAQDAPNDPHSIHLHGIDVDAANDGVPETSIGAVPVPLGDIEESGEGHDVSQGEGNVVVYMFSPKNPGTYMYHCHQEADIHVQMGMYGALIIYNTDDEAAQSGPGSGKGGKLWGWHYDKDYILLLSEVDTGQHDSELYSYNPPYNPVDYKPQYWFINGLSFPNTVHVGLNWNDWIAGHKGYDPFIVGSISKNHPNTTVTKGEKVLLRVINMGFETQPMHMHGFHGKIIGSDQRAWPWANDPMKTVFGEGLEKNTLTIGSGETYEWLLDFGQQSMATSKYPPNANGMPPSVYSGGTQSRYTDAGPTSNTTQDKVIPMPGTDPQSTYTGGPAVTGLHDTPMNGQLFPFHNHDDYKATNDGTYPGGMFTMIETLP